MNRYISKMIIRDETVSGVGPWLWIETDTGAWDGPKSDWEESHINAINDFVDEWNVCIQAGGNQGMYPRLLAGMFKTVYTFEPDETNFYCLVHNCQLDNIVKMQAALGSINQLVGLNRISNQNTGMHTISGQGIIPQISIDNLGLTACDFIMLDIEGYEINALQGAFNTIDQFRPLISCENGNDAIKGFLQPFGYTPIVRSRADTYFKVLK